MSPMPDGIIRNPVMSMPPMLMSAESHSTWLHVNMVSKASARMTTIRSRRSTDVGTETRLIIFRSRARHPEVSLR